MSEIEYLMLQPDLIKVLFTLGLAIALFGSLLYHYLHLEEADE